MQRALLLIFFALFAGIGFAKAPIRVPPSATTTLKPEARQVLIARTVVGIMRAKHYPDEKLDPGFAREVLDKYLNSLDPGHFFFTRGEVTRFHQQYDEILGKYLKNGNLQPAFTIYSLYARQVKKRIRAALSQLKHKPSFTGNTRYRFDRRQVPWVKNSTALDRLWTQRIDAAALSLILAGKKWPQVVKALDQRYRYALKNVDQTTSSDVFQAYMNAFTQIEDPHSSYFSPFQAQQFQIEMSLQLEGIGAQLTDQNGYATIVRIIPGGPAAKNGKLRPGDRIAGVAQGKNGKMIDVVGWRLDDIVKLIRGHKNTAVRLQILPAGALPGSAEKNLTLVRNTIELNAERAQARTYLIPYGNGSYRVGVITIPSFYVNFRAESNGDKNYTSVTRDVRALVRALKKQPVAGILLDLRNNGGGSLEQAAALTGLFIPGGPVVQIMNRDNNIRVLNTPKNEKPVYNGPLAVLVNRFSASATEIFTGALQDYHRALILGSHTWGKGTVQTLVQLNNYLPGFRAGELKFTIAQFFRVDGSSTQRRGVTPDIALPAAIDDRVFGEDAYPNALPWKEIAPANYQPVPTGLMHALPALTAYFRNKIEAQSQFRLFKRRIQAVRKTSTQKTIALNLKQRKQSRLRHRAERLDFINAWRKLEHKSQFKNLEQAGKSRFSPPDVILKTGANLLAALIAYSTPVKTRFVMTSEKRFKLLCTYYAPGAPVRYRCEKSSLPRTGMTAGSPAKSPGN